MDVLAAIILILTDAPVTCILLVNSRKVISVIENDLKIMQLDLMSGQDYLDKIIQIPFYLPELNPVQVTTFLKFTAQAKKLNIDCIIKRLSFLKKFKRYNQIKIPNEFTRGSFKIEGGKDVDNEANLKTLVDVIKRWNLKQFHIDKVSSLFNDDSN